MTVRAPGDNSTFDRYYLKNVAVSEGCGCAESVLRKTRAVKTGDTFLAIFTALKKRFWRV